MPVMNDDASDARKFARPWISWGSPMRRWRVVVFHLRTMWSGAGPGPPMLVPPMGPGAMPLTRMPSRARSIAACRTRLVSAPFEQL